MMLAELDSMRALNTAFVTHAGEMRLGAEQVPRAWPPSSCT